MAFRPKIQSPIPQRVSRPCFGQLGTYGMAIRERREGLCTGMSATGYMETNDRPASPHHRQTWKPPEQQIVGCKGTFVGKAWQGRLMIGWPTPQRLRDLRLLDTGKVQYPGGCMRLGVSGLHGVRMMPHTHTPPDPGSCMPPSMHFKLQSVLHGKSSSNWMGGVGSGTQRKPKCFQLHAGVS